MRYAAMDSSLGRGGQPASSIFPIAREAGLDGVELCLRADYARDALWSLAGARSARSSARAVGLDIPSLALLMLNEGSFAGDGERRERARSIVRHSIEVAREVGARIILLPFFGAGRIEGPTAVAQVIEALHSLAPVAEAAGVMLGIETTLPAASVVDIVRAVGSPAVSNYFDVANAVWLTYDPVTELEALSAAGALPQIHIKDIQEQPGDRPPGEGRVPYPAVAAALRRLAYDGYLVFETHPTTDPVAAARRHMAFVSALLDA